MVHKTRPNLVHLHVYGCKAYALNKQTSKKEKLKERAHIGHLVGYDARNIFRIWIPSQRKVIRTRDVIFDDSTRYDPHDIDVMQAISEPMLPLPETFEIPNLLTDLARITEVESDLEDEINLHAEQNQQSIEKGQMPASGNSPNDSANDSASHDSAKGKTFEYLPSPLPSEATPPPDPKPSQKEKKVIGLELDQANILPEGVRRERKGRKQAYFAALKDAENGEVISFHSSFAAFAKSLFFTKFSQHRLHRDSLPAEPKHFGQMLKHSHSAGFQEAIKTEIKALEAKGTWKEVPTNEVISKDNVIIPTIWIFKYKFDEEGYLTKYKARLVAKGDFQKTDQDSYAATLAARIFRALMAIVATFDLETRQYDAINAFANSPIDEPIYCKPPEGWPKDSGILLLLQRALYGLKQASALWYRLLSEALIGMNFEPIPGADCLFISRDKHLLLFFFVDDIVLLYDRRWTNQADVFQTQLFDRFEMRHLGELEWFLGIQISRKRENGLLWLSQQSYIEKIVSKFNVSINLENKGPATPLPYGSGMQLVRNSGQATNQEIHAYQQIVGSINFAAVITRPDVAFAASKLSEFLTNPSKCHSEAAIRTLKYLGHSKTLTIWFNSSAFFGNSDHSSSDQTIFLASSDASFADDPATRYSSQGYGFKLFSGMIDWKASKQKTVTTSSTEAELLAISSAGKELIWWTRLFQEINLDLQMMPNIQCDNRQTIRALTENKLVTKLRHVDIHKPWLRQEIAKDRIKIQWVPTATILADGLTKALPPQRHASFVKLLGLKGQRCHEIKFELKPNDYRTVKRRSR